MGILCGVQVQAEVRKLYPRVMSDDTLHNAFWGWVTGKGEFGVQQPGPQVQGLCRGGPGQRESGQREESPRGGTHQLRVDVSAPQRVLRAGTTCTTLDCEVFKQKQHQMLSRALISCSPLKSLFLMLSRVLQRLEKFHPLQNRNSTTKLLYCVPLGKRYSKP